MIYLFAAVFHAVVGFNTEGLHSVISYILYVVCAGAYIWEMNKKEDDRSEIEVLLDNPKALEKMVDDAIEEMKEELKGTEKGLQLLEMMDDPEAMQELRDATMEALIGELR